jgi:hypothetical protein
VAYVSGPAEVVGALMTVIGGHCCCLLPVANSATMITECYGRGMVFFAPRCHDDTLVSGDLVVLASSSQVVRGSHSALTGVGIFG